MCIISFVTIFGATEFPNFVFPHCVHIRAMHSLAIGITLNDSVHPIMTQCNCVNGTVYCVFFVEITLVGLVGLVALAALLRISSIYCVSGRMNTHNNSLMVRPHAHTLKSERTSSEPSLPVPICVRACVCGRQPATAIGTECEKVFALNMLVQIRITCTRSLVDSRKFTIFHNPFEHVWATTETLHNIAALRVNGELCAAECLCERICYRVTACVRFAD